jgi:hypothetical protein
MRALEKIDLVSSRPELWTEGLLSEPENQGLDETGAGKEDHSVHALKHRIVSR